MHHGYSEGVVAVCNTRNCSRVTWNKRPGEPCCRTCKSSGGSRHGPCCEANAAGSSADSKKRKWDSASPAAKKPRVDKAPYPGAPDRSRWQTKGTLTKKLYLLDADSDEYAYVEQCFMKTMSGKVIDRIERVENMAQHAAFSLHKKTVSEELGSKFDTTKMVRMLFHGTSAQSTHDIIHGVAAGYEPLAAGSSSGAVHGDGTYFARDANYSHRYTKAQSSGKRQMVLNEVVVGLSTKGEKGIKLYPKVPGAANASTRYHSLVDCADDPSIFVIAHSTAAYPAFLITYS